MTAFLRRYPVPAAIGALILVLAGVLALEVAANRGRSEAPSASAARATPVAAKLLPTVAAVNPDQEYAEIASRPLFIATRRPAPPQNAPSSAPAMVKGQYALTAVMIAGDTKIALLREKSSGRVVRVEQGKDMNGITVAQIEPGQVTLAQSGDHEIVPLLVAKAGGAAGTAPAPAGPFAAHPVTGAAAAPPPGTNPMARAAPGVAQPAPQGAPPAQPPVNPNLLFGPRPGGLTPAPANPVADPTTATPATTTPMTPEELLQRRRERRNQQSR